MGKESMAFWKSKNRTYWKDDQLFLQFQNKIMKEYWDFQETWENLKLNHCFPNEIQTGQKIKELWLQYIKEWNELRELDDQEKTIAFAGISFLLMLLPYNEIDNLSKVFTRFQLNQFNIISVYNGLGKLPNIENLKPFMKKNDGGPLLPAAYKQWLDHTYDKACWWACYTVYERQNNLSPLVDDSSFSDVI